MARRLSRSDKEKWVATTPPPTKRPPVRIPVSDNTDLIAANKLTIIGRVTNPLLQNTRAVINFLPQVWGLEDRVEGRDMGPEKFQFRFRSEYDLQVVLSKGPYHYKKWMLLLQRWEPTVSESFPSAIAFWIRIHGIPLHFCNEPTITTIGDNLGYLADKVVDEAKIRVEFNGLQPLEMTMEIQLPSDDIIAVEFEYLKIEKHCFTCFSLFHEDQNCPVKSRSALPIKERNLGITQRIALQRIEADKRRHDERRGYRRPSQHPAPVANQREESRQKTVHYSDHRDSHRTPRDSNSLTHRSHRSQARPSRSNMLEESRRSHRDDSRTLSSGVRVQNLDVPVDPRSTPAGAPHSLDSHTPSPRNLRERLEYPLDSGNNGGQSLISSGERRSVLARIGEPNPIADSTHPRGPLSFDSARLQDVEIQFDGISEQQYISPHQIDATDPVSTTRIPATQRLGESSGPITINFGRTSLSPPEPTLPSKSAGKRKATKPPAKKKSVRSSPLQSFNLRKINMGRSINPPRKKLCVEKEPSLPCDKAGTSTNKRAAGRARGTDFRPPPHPLP
ncbi:Uncharacterized protein Rs2_19393 [Raphanus sativus]|nr:Uncharacterized protein Rs2_19393 [Raphanus sativus]